MLMSPQSATAKSGVIVRIGLWAMISFTLNLAWEIVHARLYTLWAEADLMSIAWALVHCTLGDVAIALAAFALAGITLRQADWPAFQPWAGGIIVVIATMAFTAGSEWYNIQAGNWAYTERMPTILGIGLSPLLQWLILPPVMTIAYRMLRLQRIGRHSTPRPIPTHVFEEGRK